MKKYYNLFGHAVEFIHFLVIIYWVSGFFVPISSYPSYRTVHSIFGITMFAVLVIFSCRCPLSLISGYLFKMADSEFKKNSKFFEPFIVGFLKRRFGLIIPDLIITIVIIIGVAISIITVLSYYKLTQ
ncbi:MAG: hypothetical protein HYW78_00035 [Parcubacteria group bacterium]|nr:hypothetical protein [Parcubacteria group bacterium]